MIEKIKQQNIDRFIQKNRALVFILSFGFIGAVFLLATRAATPFLSYEAESGNNTSEIRVVDDTSASGGKKLRFGPGSTGGGGGGGSLPPPPSSYKGPITISSGGTYSGAWQSTSSSTPVITIKTSQPVTIENSYMRGPGYIIKSGTSGVKLTVRNTVTYGTGSGGCKGRQVNLEQFHDFEFTNNYFEKTGGVYLFDYKGNKTSGQTVKILRNKARNIMSPGGCLVQFAQMNRVYGVPHMEIAWNEVINEPGKSRVEDNINLYYSGGSSGSPLRIHNNFIRGAFGANPSDSSYSGGGIMTGDGGNSGTGNTVAHDNIIVGVGNYGLAIASGNNIVARDNRVISSGMYPDGSGRSYYSNVGAYTWDYRSAGGFNNNRMYDNVVGYYSPNKGSRNDWWLPDCSGNCSNTRYKSGQRITLADEEAEVSRWKNKLNSSNIEIGPK